MLMSDSLGPPNAKKVKVEVKKLHHMSSMSSIEATHGVHLYCMLDTICAIYVLASGLQCISKCP